jgi:glutathione reductase (NADPH)
MTNQQHYDLICLGGGSGGIACAVKAAKLGKKVAVIEKHQLGGTCVNRGCVPKKVMWHAANMASELAHDYPGYGFNVTKHSFDWEKLIHNRSQYIGNIHNAYNNVFKNNNITHIQAWGEFVDDHTLLTDDHRRIKADHIMIAPGGRPTIPDSVPGYEHGITSDYFFDHLETQPAKAVVVGGGYIAVELAGVLEALGTDTTLLVRKHKPLRHFDDTLSDTLVECMSMTKLKMKNYSHVAQIKQQTNQKYQVVLHSGEMINDVDQLIWAIGRSPNIDHLGLKNTNINVDQHGYILADDYQQTNVDGIYAIGDVTGRYELTPVAIQAGRRLARRLFNGESNLKTNYHNVPSVVFSHPPIGTIGLTEAEAVEKYGQEGINVYKTRFTPLYSAVSGYRVPSVFKLVTKASNEQIIGCHGIGKYIDEMMQGLAIAVNMGATKQDFDDTIAIHPTSAEEYVTMS